jgi:hypothetical protein
VRNYWRNIEMMSGLVSSVAIISSLVNDITIIHSEKIAPLIFRLLCRNKVSAMFNVFTRRASLVAADYKALAEKILR